MAYRRRYVSRSRPRRRSSSRAKPTSTTVVARRSARHELPTYSYGCAAKKLMHFVPKSMPTALTGYYALRANTGNAFPPDPSNSTFGNCYFFNGIAQGTGLDERALTKVMMKNLLLRYWLVGGTDVLVDPQRMELYSMMVVYDNEPPIGSTPPPVTDILDSAEPLSFQRIDSRDRFHIVFRKTLKITPWPINTTTYAGGGLGNATHGELKIPVNKLATYFVGDPSASFTAVNRGSLVLYILGQSAAGGGNSTLYIYPRMSFSDLE